MTTTSPSPFDAVHVQFVRIPVLADALPVLSPPILVGSRLAPEAGDLDVGGDAEGVEDEETSASIDGSASGSGVLGTGDGLDGVLHVLRSRQCLQIRVSFFDANEHQRQASARHFPPC